MKCFKVFFVLISLFSSVLAGAQPSEADLLDGCNSSVRRFFNGCRLLVRGVSAEDPFEVALAVDSLNSNIKVPGQPFTVSALAATPLDTASLLPPERGCFEFTASYGIHWLDEHGVGSFLESPSLLREIGGKCKVLSLRLAAGSTAAYSVRQRGRCKWFVFYEPHTDVGVSIECPVAEVSPVHYGAECLWYADWLMPSKEQVKVTFTNRSANPSTIILISN